MGEGQLVIELYVLGRAPSSETALANLKRICDRHLGGRGDPAQRAFALEIIDVLENPQAAEDARVTATPTLVKRAPGPIAYVVGDLSATETVLRVLGIDDDEADGARSDRGQGNHRENR